MNIKVFGLVILGLFDLHFVVAQVPSVKESRVVINNDGWELVGDLVILESENPTTKVPTKTLESCGNIMAKKWNEVIQSEGFQSLSTERKEVLKSLVKGSGPSTVNKG